ncbi:unnamed protein product [Peronospora belbahrii]|uniref:dolichyl-phosphate beta-glucosyltransferase n=1 Tax=Peronospora belbahrii TaxID=622444 RepID=A0ABN8CP98_9STRA|nr:unnamed protein product [Peronospora belbahrii]
MIVTSMTFNAAVMVVSIVLMIGAVLLLVWMFAPIVEAKRLAEEVDPVQEATYIDPNNHNQRLYFGSLGDERAEVLLTVVIPAYNEEERILVTIKDTVAFLDEKQQKDRSFTYEIIVVDDCSVDNTTNVVLTEVQKHSVRRIRLLKLQKNHGKGGAIRKGVMRARGERVLFADADNATEIRDYDKLALALEEAQTSGNNGVVVCGSRAHLEEQAIAKRNPLRNLLMYGFHLIVSTLCIKNVRDTQCGFKLFDRTAARVLFAPMHIERWAFDVELLYLAAMSKMTIKALAVQWTEVPGSKLRVISATITMLREIILIRHAQPLLRVASEMIERGYRVSFATHDSGREWAYAYGVPFLSAGPIPISAEDLRVKLRAMTRDASNFRGILTMFNDIYVRAARPMFDALLPQLETNGSNSNAPDLLVVDIATVGAQDLAHKLKVPYILNSPSLLFNLGEAPSYVPAWGTGFSDNMSLQDRCMNILFPRLLSVALTPPFMELNKVRYELDLPPFRSQHDLFKEARVILNTAFGLEHPQPLSPLVDAVGPIMPTPGGNASKLERQPLPAALRSWLDASMESIPSLRLRHRTASHHQNKSSGDHELEGISGGVVYLNLGTMVYIDAWQAQALVDGLLMGSSDQPVKVLWILPTDQHSILPPALPPRLVLKPPSSSLSNLEILNHPAIRLVVSHCGMMSTQETLVMGKPLLCIPFFVDQPDVAARVADAGAGLSLDKNLLSAPYVHAAVTQLLTNASYTRAAQRVGSLLERAGGIARAIDVIDATLRLGFDHLATLNLTAPWHKTALLDVWAVCAALICLLAVFLRIQWLLLYFLLSESFKLWYSLILGPSSYDNDITHEDGDEAEDDHDSSDTLQSRS